MSNYSYSEIQNMQKKALERVREMRKNSEKLLKITARNFSNRKDMQRAADKAFYSALEAVADSGNRSFLLMLDF